MPHQNMMTFPSERPEAEVVAVEAKPRRSGMSQIQRQRKVKKGMDWHRVAKSFNMKWNNQARKSLFFYENQQRPPEVRSDNDQMYVTLNIIRNKVDTKVGILTSAKPEPEVSPRGMEDE